MGVYNYGFVLAFKLFMAKNRNIKVMKRHFAAAYPDDNFDTRWRKSKTIDELEGNLLHKQMGVSTHEERVRGSGIHKIHSI